MNKQNFIFFTVLIFQFNCLAQPVSLHPQNPHYLFFKGKSLVLVTSAEHNGAVINADFDYEKYLCTM